jgi:transcriptional regulator with XRE-family HTH domain
MRQFSFNKIKEFREVAGLTQAQLADRVGVMVQQISAWENSGPEKSLTVRNLEKIAKAVGKKTCDFFA